MNAERRSLSLTDARATVGWNISEFDDQRVMVTVHAGSVAFDAHFNAEEWAKFQAFIAGKELVTP